MFIFFHHENAIYALHYTKRGSLFITWLNLDCSVIMMIMYCFFLASQQLLLQHHRKDKNDDKKQRYI